MGASPDLKAWPAWETWTAGTSRDKLADLKRDDFSSIRHPALAYWRSMIFSENRNPLFGIML
jgi:hypothetical protein